MDPFIKCVILSSLVTVFANATVVCRQSCIGNHRVQMPIGGSVVNCNEDGGARSAGWACDKFGGKVSNLRCVRQNWNAQCWWYELGQYQAVAQGGDEQLALMALSNVCNGKLTGSANCTNPLDYNLDTDELWNNN